MNKVSKLLLVLLFQIFVTTILSINLFSPIIRRDIFFYKTDKTDYQLSKFPLIGGSEIITIDSLKLHKDKDYKINYQDGKITIKTLFLNDSKMVIQYKIIPDDVLKKFSLYKEQTITDTSTIKLHKRFSFNSEDNSVINISGSKSISVTVGGNKDLAIDQSLFLTLDGEISDNLNIEAQLSDSSVPLSEEGNSEQLSNLDRIFIKIYTKKFEVAFGDLDFKIANNELLNYKTKFEGLKLKYSNKNFLSGAIAVSKGKKKSVNFSGQNGVQGPYYLSLRDVNSAIKIIAGSEEIYLDGIQLSRGTDYSIDYDEGSITFTNEHLISDNSHIQADFQYSNENYKQNIYLYSLRIPINKMFEISSGFVYQIDDKMNPLNLVFSKDDLDSLAIAGDNSAWGVGIFENESGNYDQMVDESGQIYYEYVGENGHFNIYFSYVGEGNGSYTQTGIGKYEYVGFGNGSWSPKKNLPLPEKKMNFDFALKTKLNWLTFYNEVLLTNYDKNLFSSIDDGDNNGFSTYSSAEINPDWDKLTTKLKLYYNYFSKNTALFSQLENSQENYILNQMTKLDSLEYYKFGSELYLKKNNINNKTKFSQKESKGNLSDNLFENYLNINQKNMVPKISWSFLYNSQKNFNSDKYSHNLFNNNILSKYKYRAVYLQFDNEKRRYEEKINNENIGGDEKNKSKLSLGTESKLHTDFSYETNHNLQYDDFWKSYYRDYIWSAKSFYNGINNDFQLNYSHQKVKGYSSDNPDGNYDIAELISNQRLCKEGIILNENYTIKNVKFYPKERHLIYVGDEVGIYDSTGVVVDNGDYIYEMVNVGESELTTELNLNLKANILPRQFSKNKFLKKIQSESIILINENSQDKDKWHIYLVDPQSLMNKKNSIYSRQIFEQSFWYEIIERKLTTHLHGKRSKSLDNRYTDFQTSEENSLDSDLRYREKRDNEYHLYYEISKNLDSRYKSEIKNRSLRIENRKRIYNYYIFTSSFEVNWENGSYNNSDKKYSLLGYKTREQISINFNKKYRLSSDLSWKKNNTKGDVDAYFYEKQTGNIFEWSMNFNYKFNKNTNLILRYHGNSYPNKIAENYLGLEIHAYF